MLVYALGALNIYYCQPEKLKKNKYLPCTSSSISCFLSFLSLTLSHTQIVRTSSLTISFLISNIQMYPAPTPIYRCSPLTLIVHHLKFKCFRKPIRVKFDPMNFSQINFPGTDFRFHVERCYTLIPIDKHLNSFERMTNK